MAENTTDSPQRTPRSSLPAREQREMIGVVHDGRKLCGALEATDWEERNLERTDCLGHPSAAVPTLLTT